MKKSFTLFLSLASLLYGPLCRAQITIGRDQAVHDLGSLCSTIRDMRPDVFAVCPEQAFHDELRAVERPSPAPVARGRSGISAWGRSAARRPATQPSLSAACRISGGPIHS